MELLPNQISPNYANLLNRLAFVASSSEDFEEKKEAAEAFSAINRQCTPSKAEEHIEENELSDPLGACLYQKTPRLVHQYKNRCLLLTTSKCFTYCRFCFRRSFAGKETGFINSTEMLEVAEYLTNHPEIKEILISGGDPMTGSDQKLNALFYAIRKARPGILIRLCTRSPIFAPERFTQETIELLKKYSPLWVIPHINHPVEISEKWSKQSYDVLKQLIDNGIPIQSQTVLLRGINDNVATLTKLFENLVFMGIKPGYLFQTDLAEGTSHFRVPLEKGKELYLALKNELSGLSLPIYAVDLPGGGGKVNIMATNFVKEGQNWKTIDGNGKEWFYPV